LFFSFEEGENIKFLYIIPEDLGMDPAREKGRKG
jgi:hypothetical protein